MESRKGYFGKDISNKVALAGVKRPGTMTNDWADCTLKAIHALSHLILTTIL